MKNTLPKLFAVFAVLVLAIIGCVILGVSDAVTVLTLPFTLLGKGLRALSISGGGGNIAATVLYVLVCLSPLALGIGRRLAKEDLLLPVCSGAMFYAVYYMINPGLRAVTMSGVTGDFILSGAVYSVLLAWAVIRLLRCCDGSDPGGVYRALRVILWVCMVEFAVAIAASLGSSLSVVETMRASNTMPGIDFAPTYIFIFLSFAASALEYLMSIGVIFLAIGLLRELEADPYSESCCRACENTAKWCRRTLVTVTLAYTALGLAQILFAPLLLSVDVSFRLPIASIALSFALLALSRLLNRGRAIKEDNELFV